MFCDLETIPSWLTRLVAAAIVSSPTILSAAAPNIVKIDSGMLRGSIKNNVMAYRGIPFASPPVGKLRWRPPQPPQPWPGVRPALHYGFDCLQPAEEDAEAPPLWQQSEDCLTLNVWTPEAHGEAKLPVIVWIHGNRFVNGATSPAFYAGDSFARDGVVFVSANYRLGRLGFFAHPALTQEAAGAAPVGNYGFMDQIAALQWVRRNIAAFGGDPNRVTLMGQSAGAESVHVLMTVPAARGLFQQAIVQSGQGRPRPPFSLRCMRGVAADGSPCAEEIGVAFAKSIGVTDSGLAALADLRSLPDDVLVYGLNTRDTQPETFSGPMIDGALVLKEPGKAFLAGEQARVNYLVGATDCELCSGDSFDPVDWFRELRTRRKLIKELFPASEQLLHEAYAGDAKRHFLSDLIFVEPSKFTSRLAQQMKQAVFVYRFSYIPRHLRGTVPGASHSMELAFVFDKLIERYWFSVHSADQAMASTMHAYWVNFAKTGNPSGKGLPPWPPYDARSDVVMVLGARAAEAKADPAKSRLNVLSRAYGDDRS